MLKPAARYFPIQNGLYEVAPGLAILSKQVGNEGRDALAFQLDSDFQKYRENKLQCRKERLDKYLCTAHFAPETAKAVAQFLIQRLLNEHPTLFTWQSSAQGGALECALTKETLHFDDSYNLTNVQEQDLNPVPYVSAFDALCSQVQDDVAIMNRDAQGQDWLSALHLCSPGHWGAEDKIGKNFFNIHTPVAGIEKINAAAASFVDMMIHKGPFVRFAWGFGTDSRLNHHPIPPPGHDLKLWKGRSFQKGTHSSPFILRVERQVLWGLPQVQASVFLIRVYFVDGEEIRQNPTERALLRSGLLSMTPKSRIYKGVDDCLDEIIAWLDEANTHTHSFANIIP